MLFIICYKYVKQKLYNMKKEDRIKTTAWLKITDECDYLEGKIHSIIEQKCLDVSIFEKINVQFDDGRILPCLREELEVINS